MIVQFLAIRVRAILNHSLADLIASFEIHTPWWRSLVVELMSHSWRSRCHLLVVYGVDGVADVVATHQSVHVVQMLMRWLENLLRSFGPNVDVVDARRSDC